MKIGLGGFEVDELKTRWGIQFNSTYGAFMLGANCNIGKYYNNSSYGYVIFYLGLVMMTIGKDHFEK